MGFDASYHAVDLGLIDKRLMPYLLGDGNIDDLVARAVHVGRTRFRAAAWGLGLLDAEPDDDAPFVSDLHVWGRPFLIADDDSAVIARAVDAYLAAGDEAAVDALARAHATRLAGGKLPGELDLTGEGEPPDADGVRWRIDLLRAAVATLRKGGGMVKAPDGAEHDAAELVAREIPLTLVELAAYTRPGWMTRGFWPTQVESLAQLFVPPAPLVAPLQSLFPKVEFFLEPGISENYMVGGWVPAERVSELVARVAAEHDDLVAALEDNLELGEDEAALELQKLTEAAEDAVSRGLPFCEATEIYSGPLGIIC